MVAQKRNLKSHNLDNTLLERKSAKGTCIMASVRYWKRKKEKEKEKEKGKKRKEKKRKEKKRKEKKRKEKKRKEKKRKSIVPHLG